MASLLRKLAPDQLAGPGPQKESSWSSVAGAAVDYLGLAAAQSTLGNAAVGALSRVGATATPLAGLAETTEAAQESTHDLLPPGGAWSAGMETPPFEVMDQPCGFLEEIFSIFSESPIKRVAELMNPLAVPSMTCGDKQDGLAYGPIDVDAFTNESGEKLKLSPLTEWATRLLEGLGILPEQDPKDISDYISPSDVQQGVLNDCYFNAAMMALAYKNPEAIADAITDFGDGTYAVTLWVPMDPSGERIPVTVEVNNIFPLNASGGPQYSGLSDDAQSVPDLWPLLIEKAYAKIKGGYGEIEGGNAGDAMALITGVESESISFGTDDGLQAGSGMNEQEWSTFAEQANQGAVVASVRDDLSDDHGTQTEIVLASGDKLHGDHAYVVTSVDVEANQVVLENPWGTDDSGGGDDLQVTVTIDEFNMYFYRFQYNPAPTETNTSESSGPIT